MTETGGKRAIEEKLHIAIGTPMFGGQCSAAYLHSVRALERSMAKDGHRCSSIILANESAINRARNTIAWHFLQSDATHLLFADADTGFRVPDIARMVAVDKPIIVGICPMKEINWTSVAEAAKAGVPAEELHRHTGLFNIVPLDGEATVHALEPFEIKRGGAGLMLIKRHVFEDLAPNTSIYETRCHGGAIPADAQVSEFFPTYVSDATYHLEGEEAEFEVAELLTEDYGFCQLWRDACGGQVFAAPWCEITHMGTYAFRGTYKDCLKR